MIDDLGLSVYAFRLYVHLKRVAAEDGTCWQKTGTLANACGMSTGSISKAKQELVSHNLIEITGEKRKHGGRELHHITITDIWEENIKRYSSKAEY